MKARLCLALILCCSVLQAASLEKDFKNPPASSRPWVYWFWLNGNITKEGITADLEAMKRVGIGGFPNLALPPVSFGHRNEVNCVHGKQAFWIRRVWQPVGWRCRTPPRADIQTIR